MLAGVSRRVKRAGVEERVVLHKCRPDEIGVKEPVDFCFCFWMAHEVPERQRFIREIAGILKPGGLFYLAEPRIHVTRKSFNATVAMAKGAGLTLVESPGVFISRAALMRK
jgi:SAM-dependent methyltransferase